MQLGSLGDYIRQRFDLLAVFCVAVFCVLRVVLTGQGGHELVRVFLGLAETKVRAALVVSKFALVAFSHACVVGMVGIHEVACAHHTATGGIGDMIYMDYYTWTSNFDAHPYRNSANTPRTSRTAQEGRTLHFLCMV